MSKNQMLINYAPGDECRIAIMRGGKLDEFYAERMSAASHVGNVYVGKVVNVESGIQAAFIDFGLEQNGFLHISDLHPQYFPGAEDDETERVGKKTPRRERPPIQRALKRGDEVIVQVIKEGIGTKGPTLTSYLSIPGRFLVMMPFMDKVGVSRKVEDEEQRRSMRRILDQLDLPDGFGFILRTAGMERTKAELKRDLAYLQRLWKDMEKRRAKGGKPRLLYAESDLLLRTLRDTLTSDIDEVVIDDHSALTRAAKFLKIVSPRSSVGLLAYEAHTPVFTAFGVDEQLKRALSREVPLPSGGSIVIDEAEALVAIDVNSGRMRGHGDAETTAYRTNIEAVEEICRQLRLRDLGGVVILDLIDMISRQHRRDIERRLRENFKQDRARSKFLAISEFGIVELTRQRMRGSLRSAHYMSCSACAGQGVIQRPDSAASDAMRQTAELLHHDQVDRVELVVPPSIAGAILSEKRRAISRLERSTSKRVDVRISQTLAADRFTLYAYDDRGADVDVSRLPKPAPPKSLETFVLRDAKGAADWAFDPSEEEAHEDDDAPDEIAHEEDQFLASLDGEETEDAEGEEKLDRPKRRRRRGGRGRGKKRSGEGAPQGEGESGSAEAPKKAPETGATPAASKKKRRRGGKGGAAGSGEAVKASSGSSAPVVDGETPVEAPSANGTGGTEGGAASTSKRRRRRRRGRGGASSADDSALANGSPPKSETPTPAAPSADRAAAPAEESENAAPSADGAPKRKRTRRGGRRRKTGGASSAPTVDTSVATAEAPSAAPAASKKKRKTTSRKKSATKAAPANAATKEPEA